jgi:hypothetical protein
MQENLKFGMQETKQGTFDASHFMRFDGSLPSYSRVRFILVYSIEKYAEAENAERRRKSLESSRGAKCKRDRKTKEIPNVHEVGSEKRKG